MATMIVRHKVADFNNWKKVVDEFTDVAVFAVVTTWLKAELVLVLKLPSPP